jgi:polyferredoxin
MSKGGRAALFVILATIGNLFVTAILFFGILFAYGLTLGRFLHLGAFAVFGSFVIAIVLTVFVYNAILKRLRKKYDFEKLMGLK